MSELQPPDLLDDIVAKFHGHDGALRFKCVLCAATVLRESLNYNVSVTSIVASAREHSEKCTYRWAECVRATHTRESAERLLGRVIAIQAPNGEGGQGYAWKVHEWADGQIEIEFDYGVGVPLWPGARVWWRPATAVEKESAERVRNPNWTPESKEAGR